MQAQELQKLREAFSSRTQITDCRSVPSFAQRKRLQYHRTLLSRLQRLTKAEKHNKLLHASLETPQLTQDQRRLCPRSITAASSSLLLEEVVIPLALRGKRARLLAHRKRRVPKKYRRALRRPVVLQQTTLRLRKRLLQRYVQTALLTAPLLRARPITKTRNYPLIRQVRLLRNSLSARNAVSRPSTRNLSPKITAPLRVAHLRLLKRVLGRVQGYKSGSFLQRRVGHALQLQRYSLQATSVCIASELARRGRRYRELRFYRKRPPIRLPKTEVTRRRRRKAGLVTFVRNSLKRPQTLLGRQNLLLPPIAAYAAVTSLYAPGNAPGNQRLFAVADKPEDDWPLF